MKAILYTRAGCHLCEDAKHILAKHEGRFGLSVTEIDIDANPKLKAQYDHCVPVVEINGKVRFRGRVNELLVLRLLEAERKRVLRATPDSDGPSG